MIRWKHTGGALVRGMNVYVERRSLILERSLSRWETTRASNGVSPGPVANFFWKMVVIDLEGISNIRVTALSFPLSRKLHSESSSMVSISVSINPSKNFRSHLIMENISRSIKEPVPRNATSAGDRSIRWVKPKVPLPTDNSSEPFSCKNIDWYTFCGENMLKCFWKDSL